MIVTIKMVVNMFDTIELTQPTVYCIVKVYILLLQYKDRYISIYIS